MKPLPFPVYFFAVFFLTPIVYAKALKYGKGIAFLVAQAWLIDLFHYSPSHFRAYVHKAASKLFLRILP